MTDSEKPRANYSVAFKLFMVEKALKPSVSIALLARNHGFNDKLLLNSAAVINTS